MRVRRWLTVLLIGVLVALAPLAYADLPDQVWIPGFYDGGDEDDAIVHILTNLNALESPTFEVTRVSVPCIHAPPQVSTCVVAGPILSAEHPRAPPTL
jgi:hypothetical protein